MIMTSGCASSLNIIIADEEPNSVTITDYYIDNFIADADDDDDKDIIADDGADNITDTENKYPVPTAFIALTFDDGPSLNTHRLLDVLKENNIRVTFFVSGEHMVKIDETLVSATMRIVEEGHEFGNHAFNHHYWGNGNYSRESMRRDFQRCQNEIIKVSGKSTPFFRPPYMLRHPNITQVLKEMEMFEILGYSPNDWQRSNTAKMLVDIITREDIAIDGQIFILHDLGNNNIIQAIPDIAHILRQRGIDFMTLSELAEHRGIDLSADFGRLFGRF